MSQHHTEGDRLVEPTTPHTWPENSWPTPDQLAAWLRLCTDEELLIFAARSIRDGQAADNARWVDGFRRCLMAGI